MVIKKFYAKNIYGYMNFNITFNEDINFLIGINGIGKTTVLKMIYALIEPDLSVLEETRFDDIKLTINHDGKDIEIHAECCGDLFLHLSTLPKEDSFALSEYQVDPKFPDPPALQTIARLPKPKFLGLQRTLNDFGGNSKKITQSNRYMKYRTNKIYSIYSNHNMGLHNDNDANNLEQIETLVQDSLSRMNKDANNLSDDLKNQIIISFFRYEKGDVLFNPKKLHESKNKAIELIKNRSQIENTLQLICREKDIKSRLNDFYESIDKLATTSGKEIKQEYLINLISNLTQLQNLDRITNDMLEHANKIKLLFEPIQDYLRIINDFFKDSNKEISITDNNKLAVSINNKEFPIEILSSGEKQLVVIFAHLLMERYLRKDNTVFVIDEPELSLHMKWQKKFSESIFSIGSDSQFILATHSPDIVGAFESRIVKLHNERF